MPLFNVTKDGFKIAKLKSFKTEKELQNLLEKNLDTVFNCRFVATEFPTGSIHSGRIDTLALSEDDNPVIIEYKKVESSDLLNQSLFYLSWLSDHRGDFEVIASKVLGTDITIDWSEIRVICIAPGYKKYDLHAVQMMGANIELWQYKLFDNDSLYLEEIFRKQSFLQSQTDNNTLKDPKMVAAGKKAALSRATGKYSVEEYISKSSKKIKSLFLLLQAFIMEINEAIEESPKKFYVAYKVTQNFACVEIRQTRIFVFLKLNPKNENILSNMRDVSSIGHYGTGNLEVTIENEEQLELIKPYVIKAFEAIGG